MDQQDVDQLRLQILDALQGADDVERKLLHEMSSGGAQSIANMSYAIKTRIKKDYKILEKVARKRKEKNDPSYDVKRLRDIVGLRIVTLYRLDALRVIPALLKKIVNPLPDGDALFDPHRFEEVVIFSTNPEGDAQGLASRIIGVFEAEGLKDKVRIETARSNYTSIHMVVWCRGVHDLEYQSVPVEIQVRTALEDVWGEIDHSLKYKKESSKDDGVVSEQKRIDSIYAHLNVMKTLIDGVAQYADQIKIQLDEIDGEVVVDRIASRSAQNPLDILDGLHDFPGEIRAVVAKAVELEGVGLQFAQDENSVLQALQHSRELLDEARVILAESTAISSSSRDKANYAIDMELALVLFEIGKRVESGANILAASEKIYHANEDRYPKRALIKYRRAAVLDALGDRISAMGKFREVIRAIQEGDSELPAGHWIRSAAARQLGTLLWEEGYNLPMSEGTSDRKARQLHLYLEAFKTTKSVHGVSLTTESPTSPTIPEKKKVANNLLYYALDYLEGGGNDAAMASAGFRRGDIKVWVREIGGNEIDSVTNVVFADTIRRAFAFLRQRPEARKAAGRVLELLPLSGSDGMSKYHVKIRREAERTLST